MAPPSHPTRDASLLSPSHYDDDASSIHSNHSDRSDQDTDSEDDEVLQGARSLADIRNHDRSVLEEEEERDRLLVEENRRRGRRGSALAMVEPLKKLFGKSFTDLPRPGSSNGEEKDEKRMRRRERRSRKKKRVVESAEHGENGELMYEMEEGGLKEGESTGSSSDAEGSDEIDRRGLLGLHEEKSRRRRGWRTWCFIHLLIAVGFSLLVLVSWRLSLNSKSVLPTLKPGMVSNGSALFAPTTILISLDGFRADFLKRGITPRLNAFIEEGVSPSYMLPSFPSVTFPNHYTLVTGLYPESHGIVGNTFWDENLKEEFYYTKPSAMQAKWWGGEPLWVTAENHGIRSAIHMWPGSEAHIMGVEPAFIDKYNGKESLENKVNRIFEWLDKPGPEDEAAVATEMRPQFLAAYVPNIDGDGHLYGPNSTEIKVTIKHVDDMLDHIFKRLQDRNLTNIVNVVVVSDHGMATTDVSRMIQLEDLIDTDLLEHIDGWPLYGLRPKDPNRIHQIYKDLLMKSVHDPNWEVYLTDTNMPERYHFSKNERIAPIWIVPKTGWAITTKAEFDIADAKQRGIAYHPRGLHGYDHEHPLMRAIFVARGPAFPHAPNSRVEAFQNIEVYNIICDSLGITPKPNNGTIRLPLKTIGLHTPETSPQEIPDPEITPSPVAILSSSTSIPPPPASSSASPSSVPSATPDAIMSISPIEASSAADPNVKPPSVVGVDPADEVSVDRPVVPDESGMTEEEKNFWEWLTGKLEGVKTWFGEIAGGDKEGKKKSGE